MYMRFKTQIVQRKEAIFKYTGQGWAFKTAKKAISVYGFLL